MKKIKKSLKDIHKAVSNETFMLKPHEMRVQRNKRQLKVQKGK